MNWAADLMEGLSSRDARKKILEIFASTDFPAIAESNKELFAWMETWHRLRSSNETFDIIAQAFADKVKKLNQDKRRLEEVIYNQRQQLSRRLAELDSLKSAAPLLTAAPDAPSSEKQSPSQKPETGAADARR